MKEIESNCQKFFKRKIEIAERYNFILGDKHLSSTQKNKFELAEDTHKLLPESYDPINKFFFMLRNSNELLLRIIDASRSLEDKKALASLFGNFFFENIFSSCYIEESLLVFIYLILEKEIKDTKLSFFALYNKSYDNDLPGFSSLIFPQLGNKEDIKGYMSLILNDFILELENKEDNVILLKIKDIFKEKENKKENSSCLTRNPTISQKNIEGEQRERYKSVYDKFDIQKYKEELLRLDNYKRESNVFFGRDSSTRSNVFSTSDNDIDEEPKEIEIIYDYYMMDIDKMFLLTKMTQESNVVLKSFLNKQLGEMTDDPTIFQNKQFFISLKQMGSLSKKIINSYTINFVKMKTYIEKIINQLTAYLPVMPRSIKCICKIIAMLLLHKDPNIPIIERNVLLANFFFNQLLFPFLKHPDKNGILTSTILSSATKKNLNSISSIFNQVLQGKLYTNEDQSDLTLFNGFFFDIVPQLGDFFDKLIQIQLPPFIEKLFKQQNDPNRDSTYSFLEQNALENVEHQSIALTWSDIKLFYEIIRDSPNQFQLKNYAMLPRHWKKIEYQIETINKKILENENQSKKTFLLFTKMNLSPEIEEKLKFKSEEKVTFQNEDEQNSNLTLPRIKYCFRKILESLQTLSKEEISLSLSIEEIVDILHRMLELEERSLSSFDNSIPLTWYGLYLKTNLSLIPTEYKENNYAKLFEEMIQETEKYFKSFDNTVMNQLLLKTKNSIKKNQVIQANLNKLIQIEKYVNMQKFVDRAKTPVCLVFISEQIKTQQTKVLMISKMDQCIHSKFQYLDKVLFEKKENKQNHCETIKDFIAKFPNIQQEHELSDEENDLFSYEEQLRVHDAIHRYSQILAEYLKADEVFSKFKLAEFNAVLYELTSYILTKIYRKLYSDYPDQKDIFFFQKCVRLDWIQPHHLVKEKKIIDEKLWETAVKYIDQMDREKSPLNKINAFSMASKIIHNSITFCSGKNELGVDDSLTVFVYLVLKSKPKRVISNVTFIKMYLNKDLQKKDKGLLMTELDMVVEIIRNLCYTGLNGVTEIEWDL